MPLCVAGMHRSGTSMIASLLNRCGLDLGPDKELLLPAADNPQGFWENRSFLKLNDAILKTLGGAWDRPPRMNTGWENEPRFRLYHKEARKLAQRFRDREPWGWKDPRNSLTLPLWNQVLPDLRVLVCVRNPLAVAESLHARNGMSPDAAFDLWLTYNQRVLSAAPSERRIVTLCDNYFFDPRAELQRVVERCGLATTENALTRACVGINPSLVHHRVSEDELARAGASDELLKCYLELCELADSSAARPLCLAAA